MFSGRRALSQGVVGVLYTVSVLINVYPFEAEAVCSDLVNASICFSTVYLRCDSLLWLCLPSSSGTSFSDQSARTLLGFLTVGSGDSRPVRVLCLSGPSSGLSTEMERGSESSLKVFGLRPAR